MGDILELLLEIVVAISGHQQQKTKLQLVDDLLKYARDEDFNTHPELFLLLMMLTYVYFYDDLNIDRTERKRIRKLLKDYQKDLTKQDHILFKNIHLHIWSPKDIKTYITTHSISEIVVQQVLHQVKGLFYEEWEYEKPYQTLFKEITI